MEWFENPICWQATLATLSLSENLFPLAQMYPHLLAAHICITNLYAGSELGSYLTSPSVQICSTALVVDSKKIKPKHSIILCRFLHWPSLLSYHLNIHTLLDYYCKRSLIKSPAHTLRVTCNKMAVSSKNEVYHISGVPVRFPCKPYPTQLQMMSKVSICKSRQL